MMNLLKSKKQILPAKLKKRIRYLGCLVCGNQRVDLDHIRTRGAGNGDYILKNKKLIINIIPECRAHHIERHTIGLKRFRKKYHRIDEYIKFVESGFEL